jgi:4-amino-4-deoxy-L-arabinose transferase-like glycosyltransferase
MHPRHHSTQPQGHRVTAISGATNATERTSLIFLWVLLGLFLAKGILIALTGAPYSGHDEIAHISYTRVVAEEGRLPRIPDLESWREARLAGGDTSFDEIPDEYYRWAGHFTTPDWLRQQRVIPRAAQGDDGAWYPSGWIYTANHPPLYYLWLAPVEKLTDHLSSEQQQYFFRLATIPFGLGTVVFAWLAARSLFRHDLFLRLLIPAFVSMQPQVAYEASIVNNDIVAIMFASGMFWLLIEGLHRGFPWKLTSWLGVLFGLAMLGKTTSASMAVLVAIAMIAGLGWRNWQVWLPRGAAVGAIGAAIIAPWQWFMLRTYGNPTALSQISGLQSWWNERDDDPPTLIGQLLDPTFFWFRWKETWGEFGWRLIELDGYMAEVYDIGERRPLFLAVLLVIALVGTAGVGVWLWRVRLTPGEGRDEVFRPQQWQSIALVVMVTSCVVGYFSVLQFGLTFSLTQARYYFLMIVPAAIMLMLGFRALAPARLVRIWGAVLFLGMVILNILIYTAWFLPYWHPMAGGAVH